MKTTFKQMGRREALAQDQLFRFALVDTATGEQAHCDELSEAGEVPDHVMVWDNEDKRVVMTASGGKRLS